MNKLINCLVFILALSANKLIAQSYSFGSYTGTGSPLSITGLGYSPEAVLIKSESAYEAVFCTNDMPDGKVKRLGTSNSALATGYVNSIDANGFTLSTNNATNKLGTVYHWVAFNEGTNISVGTYTGTGLYTSQTITIGFQAEMIFVMGDGSSKSCNAGIYFDSYGAKGSEGFYTHNGSNSATEDLIQSTSSTSFTIGESRDSPCDVGIKYYYIAFNESAGENYQNNVMVGNGRDNYSVSISGTQPDFIIFHDKNTAAREPVFRMGSVASTDDKSFVFSATAVQSNLIKKFNSTGIEVGTDNKVNRAWQDYGYFAMKGGVLLPVDLVSFSGNPKGKNILLKWSTASEINSDFFEVLHSTDCVNFESIGRVKSSGNSAEIIDYTFLHEDPSDGTHYYQLLQVDFDGKEEKSNVIVLRLNKSSDLSINVFPNPIQEHCTVNIYSENDGKFHLQIFDLNGKLIYTEGFSLHKKINHLNINTEYFLPGEYFLLVSDQHQILDKIKLVKER